MAGKLRRWLSDIISPKDTRVAAFEANVGTESENPMNQSGFDDPEYTMNLERTLRVLESSLHNSDNSEEIAMQTMAAVCEFYDADFCGVLDVDLDVGVWTPELWYEPEFGPMHTTLFNEYEYIESFYSWVQALRTGEAIIIPDVEAVKEISPEEYEGYKRLAARSVMAIPFWKKPTGFLVVRNMKRYKDKSSLLRMLSFVCSQMWEDKKHQDSAALIIRPSEIKSDKDVILNAFGKIEIKTSRGGINEESLVAARVWKLLIFLLIKGTRVSTQDIITNLWPDEEPEKASANIRASLYRFRQKTAFILDDNIIISRSNGYMLNPDLHFITDIYQFEECVEKAKNLTDSETKRKLLEKGFNLYRGRFYETSDSEQWLLATENRYSAMYMELVRDLLHTLYALQDTPCIREYASRSIEIEPGNPGAYYWMIVCDKHPLSSTSAKQALSVAQDKLTEEEYSKLVELLEYWEEHGMDDN
jgi:DNA-binding SARP family transcriptional activator